MTLRDAIEGKEYKNECLSCLNNACAFSYKELLDRHEKEYKKYFTKLRKLYIEKYQILLLFNFARKNLARSSTQNWTPILLGVLFLYCTCNNEGY